MIAVLVVPLIGRLDPPLDPSGDEARGQLRRELARPEYYDANVLERISNGLDRLINKSVGAASSAPLVTVVVAMVVTLLLATAVILILSQARRTARAESAPAALTDEVITADELRARAEAALRGGDPVAALIDAFRATAVRQIERGRIDDVPQATAHELAGALAATFPEHGPAVRRGADLFDQVLYGDRPATVEQARDLLALDDALAGRAARR